LAEGYSVALSSDGTVLAIGLYNPAPYVKVYDWNGTNWTERPTPPNLATKGYSVALSSDGTVLAVGSYTVAPYVKVYDWNGTNCERATPPNLATNGYSAALSSNGDKIFIGSYNYSPFFKAYSASSQTEYEITFDSPPADGLPITADYTVDGIHKTDQYVVDVSCSIQFGEGV